MKQNKVDGIVVLGLQQQDPTPFLMNLTNSCKIQPKKLSSGPNLTGLLAPHSCFQ